MAVTDLSKSLWLRAKDLSTGSVTSWPDQSGAARNATSVNTAPTVATAATPAGGKAVAFSGLGWLTTAAIPMVSVSASAGQTGTEGADKAFDGSTSTKWLAAASTAWIQWQTSLGAPPSYTITSGNDAPDRDPKNWTLYGSTDGATWTAVDTRTGEAFASRLLARTFTIAGAVAYNYWKLDITANNGGTSTQLSEISMAGVTMRAVLPGEVWVVVKSTSPGGGLYCLNDGSTGSNYTRGTFFPDSASAPRLVYESFGRSSRTSYTATMDLFDQWRLYRVATDGATYRAWLDGTQQLSQTNVGMAWGGTPTIGATPLNLGDPGEFNGQIAEVLFRPTISTASEVADLITYFNTEHGLMVPGGSTGTASTTATIAASAASPAVAIAGAAPIASTTATIAASAASPAVAIAGAINGAILGAVAGSAPTPITSLSGTVSTPGVVLSGWGADESQRARVQFASATGALIVTAPVAVAPATITERPLTRQSHQMPAPTPDADGKVRSLGDYTIEEDANVGVPHIWVNGQDVTYFRGAPTTIGQWSSSQPGGDETAAVEFPQLTPFDVAGVGDLAWLKADAPVEIAIVREDGTRLHQFAGHLVSDNAGLTQTGLSNGWHVEGTLAQADYYGHRVPTMLEPTDIGTLITKHLNSVVSRRYGVLKAVATGITSRQRGAYGDTEWDYVQNLLGTAWTATGAQWTIARTATPRQYELRTKDRATQHWTLTAGAPGVEPDLTRDDSQRVDAIYGRGVGADGYAWANWKYPNLLPDDAPAYPFSGAGTVISIGTTDAGTDSGDGVSTWQERARQLGYTLTVDGVYSSADATTCEAIQRRYGIQVDGVVGPQTWAATFAVGSNGGDLSGCYRAPLAIRAQVEPYVYAANGAVTGRNAGYVPGIIRHERDVDYGPGVTKAEATTSALRELARDADPGWAGTITLTTDPWEGSKWEMFEGQNVRLLGWRGQDLLLHIVEISKDPQSLTVTLTVDSKARDAMTLSSVLGRDRDAKADPARRPGNVNRRSRQEQDMAVEFDGESGAGVIPRHALFGGLWTVIRIPVSQVGRIAKVDVRTSGPASKFCLALFGKPIQPSHLKRLVGDPLSGDNPFARTEATATTLDDDFGFIEAFGGPGSAAGYWPKQEGAGVLTGRLVDTGGLEYVSAMAPWVWVAEWSPTSTFISGRVLPAPIQ